jgi:hypothetical protein
VVQLELVVIGNLGVSIAQRAFDMSIKVLTRVLGEMAR